MALDGDLSWLLDTSQPLIISDDTWRDKAKAVQSLDQWYWEPSDRVKEVFTSWRDGKELDLDDDDWEDVTDHLSRDVVSWIWFACYYKNRNSRKKERATPTPAQLAVLWRFAAMVDEGMPVRIALLKARQFGFSWLFCQIVLWLVCFNQHLTALHVAHDKKSTQAIFRYLKEGHKWLPEHLRPLKAAASKNELYLANPDEHEDGDTGQDSRAIVDTAGNEFAGTAEAVQIAHTSEIGKWDKKSDPETIWTSFANAMQDEPNTFIFAESTAHGSGTFWHQMWQAACLMGMSGGEKAWNGFTPIFIPWYFDPRNTKPAPPDMVLLDSDNSEFGNEVAVAKQFNLDLDQMYWRRRAIQKQPDGRRKVDLFNQEHPSSPEIAWLFAGGKWLPTDIVASASERIRTQIQSGRLVRQFVGDIDPCEDKDIDYCLPLLTGNQNNWLRRRNLGALTIYRWPDWHHDYIVGIDVSEGGDGADASCVKVYQRIGYASDGDAQCRIAAEWYGLCPEDKLADIAWRLGWFYSTGTGRNRIPAMLAWERTGPGRGLGLWLRSRAARMAVPYPHSRMYRQQSPDSQAYSQDSHYGVSTNKSTKPVMMGALLEAIRDNHVQFTPEDLKEVQTVALDDRGLVVTKGRDRTMAAAMAVYVCMFTTHLWGKEDASDNSPEPGTVAWSIAVAEKGRAEADRDDDEEIEIAG